MSTAANWTRIRELFHRAIELPAHERAAFLREQSDDEAIRQEVESLLAAHADADGFLDGSRVGVRRDLEEAPPPRLAPGHRLGSFEILGTLGVGGMGEVYRARDAKLHRDVAVKLLPAAFTSDPDRLARFEREARLLAALNHPHIAAIHSVEDIDGLRVLVLELVEGPTLADRLAAGPLPPQEALAIASELAEALEAAHAKGIIHRDLKPANVKITPAGVVKLLDFGLATATARDDPGRVAGRADIRGFRDA